MAELLICEDVARSVVADGVAPAAAAGCAVRRDAKWEVSSGASPTGPLGAERAFFDLASVTKPMTALAIARSGMAREAPLGSYVPELAKTAAGAAPIEALLAHRAGLEAHVQLYAPLLEGVAVDRAALLAQAADALREVDREAPVYSDLGYLLAGEALARFLSVEDAGAAIERLVVAPLGMEDELGTARTLEKREVGFTERVLPTEEVAWRGGVVRGRVHDENAWAITGAGGSGHAGMFGTIRGALAFACAAHDAIVLGEGPLAAGDLGWMIRPREGGTLRAGFDGKSESGSSAGSLAGPRTFGHLGFTGTSVWIDPDAAACVVLLTNRVHPTRDNAKIRAARPLAHDALWRLTRA